MLLIVDRDKSFGKALERVLERYFDDIFVAPSVEFAFGVLSDILVTHLIVNHDLGHPDVGGINLIVFWRNERPKIEKAILLTDDETPTIYKYDEIDDVLPKNVPMEELVKALGVWKRAAPE